VVEVALGGLKSAAASITLAFDLVPLDSGDPMFRSLTRTTRMLSGGGLAAAVALVSVAPYGPAAATALGAGALVPASASAAVAAVVLDPSAPIDVAAYPGSLAWLRPDPAPTSNLQGGGLSKHTKLVVRSNGTAAVLPARVSAKTYQLGLGSGIQDELCVVLVTPRGLATVSLGNPAKPRLVPGTRPGDHSPGLRHGVLSFARRVNGVDTLQIGSLRSSNHHVLWSAPHGADIVDTTLGARERIAFQTIKTDASGTTRYVLNSIRRGHAPHELIALAASEGADNADVQGMGRATLAADGTRISVSRYTAIGPNDTTDFSLRDGRKLSSHRNTQLPYHYIELPLGREGAAAVTVAGPDDAEDQSSNWALHLLPN
jgi:hypothetical protein